MRPVYERFGDDLDVASLFAEALIRRTPWQLWNLDTGEPAEGADTLEAVAVLERAIAAVTPAARPTPACCTCTSTRWRCRRFPSARRRAADQLRDAGARLRPSAAHADPHRPAVRATTSTSSSRTSKAIVADRKFLAREGALNFYALYCCHDLHFKVYGAMFLGQFEAALEAADEITAIISDDLLRVETMPMADWAEGFVPMRLHVLVRFGRWQEILAEPLPADPELYCMTTAILHYAKGIAHADARRSRRRRAAARAVRRGGRAGPRVAVVFNNTGLDLLAIAAAMLDGELEYRAGNFDAGVRPSAPRGRARRRAALRRAVGMDAAGAARAWRAAARAGPHRRGRGRLPRRPGAGRDGQPAEPAPQHGLEPARPARVPGPKRETRPRPPRSSRSSTTRSSWPPWISAARAFAASDRVAAMDPLDDAIDRIAADTGFSGVVRVDRGGETELARPTGSPTARTRSPTRSTPSSRSPAAPRA